MLHQAGLRLDDAFVPSPGKIWEENVVAAALPPDTRWLTCWDPVCRRALIPDLAEELAQIIIYSISAPGPFLFGRRWELLLMGCSSRPSVFPLVCQGKQGNPEKSTAFHLTGASSRGFRTRAHFSLSSVWSAPGIGQEEERLMDMAALFGLLGGLDEDSPSR